VQTHIRSRVVSPDLRPDRPAQQQLKRTASIVDLMEYQAKELFAKHGVPVSMGTVVENSEDARAAADALGGRVVVKAQVQVGGRGKAGGVKLAESPDDAVAKADAIRRMDIKGHTVRRVLIAPTADIAEEY